VLPPPPTPAALAAERWFGGKGAAVGPLVVEDAVDLGGGASYQVIATGGDRYLWTDGDVAAALTGGTRQRPIGRDQSNTSYVVDERLVVKLYRRLWPGTHPEVELSEFLSGRVACVPTHAGAHHWGDHAIALVQEYVPGEDGWEWAGRAIVEGDAAGAGRLGALTAELHAALAGLGSAAAPAAVRAGWERAAARQLDDAIAAQPADVARELGALAPAIRAELAALATAPAELQRVHGDYHVGQVLVAPDRLVVLDFEGEPTRPVAERARPGTRVRDVAAMLRSFDHVARHVGRDVWPGHEAEIDRWIDAARSAFLDAYGPVDATLLRALEVEKECYEFVYAATYLPEWTHAPLGGMRWLMARGG
jgi:maltokinase